MSPAIIRTLCGNVSNKRRSLVIKGVSNPEIGGTVAGDDYCTGVQMEQM